MDQNTIDQIAIGQNMIDRILPITKIVESGLAAKACGPLDAHRGIGVRRGVKTGPSFQKTC